MDEGDEPSISFLRSRKPGGLKSSKDLADLVPLINEYPKHASRVLLKDADKYHVGSSSSIKDDQACDYGATSDDGSRILEYCSSRVPAAGYLHVLSWLNECAKSIYWSFKEVTPRPVQLDGMMMPLLLDFEKGLDGSFRQLKLAMDLHGFGLAWISAATGQLTQLYFTCYELIEKLDLPNSSWNRDYAFPLLRYRELLYSVYRRFGTRISWIRDSSKNLLNVDLDALKGDNLKIKRECFSKLEVWKLTFNTDLKFIHEELFGIIDELVDLPLVGKSGPLQAKICVLVGAVFGVKMMTLLVTGALFAAFGSPEWLSSNYGKLEKLLTMQIPQPEMYQWSQSFVDIQKPLSEEINKFVRHGAFGLKEVRDVSWIIEKDIVPMLEGKMDVEGNEDLVLVARRSWENLYNDVARVGRIYQILLNLLGGGWIRRLL